MFGTYIKLLKLTLIENIGGYNFIFWLNFSHNVSGINTHNGYFNLIFTGNSANPNSHVLKLVHCKCCF